MTISNPFAWKGSDFLFLYVLLVPVVIALSHWIRRWHWSLQPAEGRMNLTDPYEIALLRGGKNEAIRIAVVSLIERGLLEVRDKIELVATDLGRSTFSIPDPLEAAILRFFRTRSQAADAFKRGKEIWEHALEPRRRSLERAGLLADETRRRFRRDLAVVGAVTLLTVAGTKVSIALAAGRRNVGFLIGVAIMGTLFELVNLWAYQRTPRGDEALADLRQLFDRGDPTAFRANDAGEVIMTAAVFGLAAVPVGAAPYVPELYPRAVKDAGSGGGGCGSSCGSSCGGGGGCGGGCGGCGG